MDHNKKALPMWESWSRYRSGVPAYDPWLDAYQSDLERAKVRQFLDLGCGTGADTQYLIERGYSVLSADYSQSALESVRRFIPGSETRYVDMNALLPFGDGQFPVVVADMSLHYFDRKTTVRLMGEIKRILSPGGVLLTRVSSTNDIAYGAGSGREIELRFYDHGGYAQRYLNEQDVKDFFGLIGKYTFRETAMTRRDSYYSTPKIMYEIRAEKGYY